MLQFTVDGSVVYRDKMVGVEKPQEFIQEPFGAVINEGDEVGNIITVKDTRTPTNSESMSVIEDVERHCPSHASIRKTLESFFGLRLLKKMTKAF